MSELIIGLLAGMWIILLFIQFDLRAIRSSLEDSHEKKNP